MCYKQPGPRCSSYATKRLNKLSKKMNENPDSFDEYEEYRQAEQDYWITPVGLKHLKDVAENTDVEYQEDARERYEFHLQKRKDALAAIGRADKVKEEPVELGHNEPTDEATVSLSYDGTKVERKYPNALAVDPENCGCTECLVGEYVRLDAFKRNASSSDLEAFARGEIGNNTQETNASVIDQTLEERSDDEDIQSAAYLAERFDTSDDGTMIVEPNDGSYGSNVSISPDGNLRVRNQHSHDSQNTLSEDLSPRTWGKLNTALQEEYVDFSGRGSGDNDVSVYSRDNSSVEITIRDRDSSSWDSSVTMNVNRKAFARMVSTQASR